MNEEIRIKFGGDTEAFDSVLGSMVSKVGSAFAKFRESINDVAREWAGAFTVGGMIVGIERVLEKFHELQDRAGNLGVSTDFLQGMQELAKEGAVGGVNTFNRAITDLSTKLGEAKEGSKDAVKSFEKYGFTLGDIASLSPEELFYKIADQIKNTTDPALRLAEAFDLMGKGGKNMVGMLSEGGDALKQMAGGVDKLDAETVKALAESKDKLDQISNVFTIWAGRAIGFFTSDLPTALGEASVGFSHIGDSAEEAGRKSEKAWIAAIQAKVDAEGAAQDAMRDAQEKEEAKGEELEKKEMEALDKKIAKAKEADARAGLLGAQDKVDDDLKKMNATKKEMEPYERLGLTDSLDYKKLELQYLDQEKQYNTDTNSLAKERTSEHNKQNELIKQRTKLLDEESRAQKALVDGEADRLRFTVGELAERARHKLNQPRVNSSHRINLLTAAEQSALNIENLENRSKNARDFGNDDLADNLQHQAENLRKNNSALTSSERDPLKSLHENLDKINKTLADDGIKVKELAGG